MVKIMISSYSEPIYCPMRICLNRVDNWLICGDDMRTKEKDRRINTNVKVENEDKQKRLPHERDESVDSSATTSGPRDVIRQAADDIEHGLVDTDLREQRGVEKMARKPVRTRK